ncbi:MAG: hypothetical protein AAGA25_15590 [Planctomycetota bacterium]
MPLYIFNLLASPVVAWRFFFPSFTPTGIPVGVPITVKANSMGMLESIRNNSSTTATVSIVVLLFALFLIFRQLGGGSQSFSNPKWMYDLNTGQLVAADAEAESPFDSGSGTFDYGKLGTAGAQVEAIVYSCGNPAKVGEGMTMEDLESIDARIGYLTRTLQRANADSEEARLSEPPKFVAGPDGQEWVPQFSPKGMQIQNDGFYMCDESTPAKRAIPS